MSHKTRRDRYIILDTESTCWDSNTAPEGEIISFGIVEVNTRSNTISREGEYFVRPKLTTVSQYCTDLTGITGDYLHRYGRPYGEVINTIKNDFGVGNKVWMAWGDDRSSIDKECYLYGIENPFNNTYIDLSAVLGLSLGETQRLGLKQAMEFFDIPFEGREHSALDDARNTARLWMSVNHILQSNPDYSPNLGPNVP